MRRSKRSLGFQSMRILAASAQSKVPTGAGPVWRGFRSTVCGARSRVRRGRGREARPWRAPERRNTLVEVDVVDEEIPSATATRRPRFPSQRDDTSGRGKPYRRRTRREIACDVERLGIAKIVSQGVVNANGVSVQHIQEKVRDIDGVGVVCCVEEAENQRVRTTRDLCTAIWVRRAIDRTLIGWEICGLGQRATQD